MMWKSVKSWDQIGPFTNLAGYVLFSQKNNTALRSRRSKVRLLPGTPYINACFSSYFQLIARRISQEFMLLKSACNRAKARSRWGEIGRIVFQFIGEDRAPSAADLQSLAQFVMPSQGEAL